MILMKFYGNLSDASRPIKTQRHVTTNTNFVTEFYLCKNKFDCNEVNLSPSTTKHSIAVVLWQLRIMNGGNILMAARNISRYSSDSKKT